MNEVTCSVNGCEGTRKLRLGLCIPHYMRKRRTGDVQPDVPVAGPRPPQPYEDADWCRARYEDDLLSFEEIAALSGCSIATVHKWFKRHGIDVPSVHVRAVLRGNDLRGERNPAWKGTSVCDCGGRKHRMADTCWDCQDQWRQKNPNWRGDDISYAAAHDRVRALFGPARLHACNECGGRANDWAYAHTDREAKRSTLGYWYSVDPAHYRPMCVPCHKALDRQQRS